MSPVEYGVVFLLVAVLGMGIPGPGDASLIAAGTAAGEGRLNIRVAIGVAAAAWAVGSTVGYEFGIHRGRGLLEHPGWLGKARRSLLAKGDRMFGQHNVMASATLPSFLSGVFKVRPGAFIAGTATAGVFWIGMYLFISYFWVPTSPGPSATSAPKPSWGWPSSSSSVSGSKSAGGAGAAGGG